MRDRQGNGRGQLDEEHSAVVLGDDDVLVLHHEVAGVAHGLGGNVDLLVGGLVHEDVIGAVLVQVRHVATVNGRGFDLQASVEGLVDGLAG